jgi:N-acyl-D-amino-acid deacylase
MNEEILIKNGKVIDGTGSQAFASDILIKGERISDVGSLNEADADFIIDAQNLMVTPGFIDSHTHLDFFFPNPRHAQVLESWVRQGVTTIVGGNCGYSPAPINHEKEELINTFWNFALPYDGIEYEWTTFGEYLDVLERRGQAFNVAIITGYNTLRTNVMGWDARFAKLEEISEMKKMLRASLQEGSFGLSLGLYYVPGVYSNTAELMEVASVLTEFNAPLVPHTRGLTHHYDKAVQEVIDIAEANKIPLQLSHHAGGTTQRVRRKALKAVKLAKERGLEVGHDNMPWAGGCTAVLAHLPPWILDGGIEKLMERLHDPDIRNQSIDEIENYKPKWPNWEHNYMTDKFFDKYTHICGFKMEKNKKLEYMTIQEIAEELNKDIYNALLDLIIEEKGKLFTVGFMDHPLAQKYYDELIADPDCSIETDAVGADFKNPFPVAYGNFTKVLGEIARDRGVISQVEAVRKMTSLPAKQMQIKERGIIKKGYFADITIFNPKTVNSRVSFNEHYKNSEGIEYVLINGKIVLNKGIYDSSVFAGKILRRSN